MDFGGRVVMGAARRSDSARLMRMDATGNGQHHKRMKALVAFSASSFDTEFPSPFGSAIYDERSGVLVAQTPS